MTPAARDDEARGSDLGGWTCETCGDTFTADSAADAVCPSCGGDDLRPATEPFL